MRFLNRFSSSFQNDKLPKSLLMKLTNQKHLFDIPDTVHYLNIASLSPSFKSIEEAGIRAVKEKSKPYLIPSSDFLIR